MKEIIFSSFAYISLLSLVFCAVSNADICTDGSVGSPQQLTGPDYTIDDSLGTQRGGNLFHSFDVFDIETGESATFFGDATVQNIISRVSGGRASLINGPLSCNLPDTNLYFINPAGIIFGEHAVLDISGSFYVSTADYLGLADAGRFDASHPENSVLTSAPPESFGFIDDQIAGIQSTNMVIGTMLDYQVSLSFIGGDMRIENSNLLLDGGQLNILSVASPGEVNLKDLKTDPFDKCGRIDVESSFLMTKDSVLDDNSSSSNIYISGAEIVIRGSQIASLSDSSSVGRINIDSQGDVVITDESFITGGLNGLGNGADINVNADTLSVSNGSIINSATDGEDTGGTIRVDVRNLEITTGSSVAVGNKGAGAAGDLIIRASEDIYISGKPIDSILTGNDSLLEDDSISAGIMNFVPDLMIAPNTIDIHAGSLTLGKGGSILSVSETQGCGANIHIGIATSTNIAGLIRTESSSNGGSGNIDILSGSIRIEDDGMVSCLSEGSGSAGNISLQAPAIEVKGTVVSDSYRSGNSGQIDIQAKDLHISKNGAITSNVKGIGNSGTINIETDRLHLSEGGRISANVMELSPYEKAMFSDDNMAGTIDITAHEWIHIWGRNAENGNGSEICASSAGIGDAGNIYIDTDRLVIEENGSIDVENYATGDAGNIGIGARRIRLSDNGSIKSHAVSGNGGNITLMADEQLYLDKSSITTHVEGGQGSGGNILLNADLALFRQSDIIARAIAGDGGNISIRASNLIQDALSILDASSQLGVDGNIDIMSPNADFSTLTQLAATFLPIADLDTDPCAARTNETASSFTVKGRGVFPEPEDMLQWMTVEAILGKGGHPNLRAK